MGKTKIIENENLGSSIDLSTWPNVFIDNLSKNDQVIYLKRREAVESYFKGSKHSEIQVQTGIHRNNLAKFVKRCLELDETGQVWGFRALIPRKRIKPNTSNQLPYATYDNPNPNKNGAFNSLLNAYPELKELIFNYFFKKNNRIVSDPVIQKKYIHKEFIKKCRVLGLKSPHDYPFNTKELARRSLYTYLEKLENDNINSLGKRYGEETSQLLRTTGAGTHSNAHISRPFEQVQFDGHKIDISMVLVLESPEGDEILVSIERIWILVIFDVGTQNVLGSHVSFEKEYNSSDVLHCIRNTVVPWVPKELTIPGLTYPKEGGYPSGVIPETQWAVWDELLYDQARANISHIVKDRLKQVVKCQVNAGNIKYPMRRSLIERFFGILEEAGFHRIVSTTGSNPNDPRRSNPEQNAMKYRITAQHIVELVDVLIAEYNATPNEGVNFMTPLEAMRSRILNNHAINQMPEEQRNEVAFLSLSATREIQGNIKDGRRPYIQYENVRYTNEILTRSPGLIGKKIELMVNVDDLRIVHAYLPDGSELGKLKAKGKWGITPHTLQVRREIYRLKNKKLIHFTSSQDPIKVYQEYLQQDLSNRKRNAKKLHEMGRTIKRNDVYQDNGEESIQHEVEETKAVRTQTTTNTATTRKLRQTLIY